MIFIIVLVYILINMVINLIRIIMAVIIDAVLVNAGIVLSFLVRFKGQVPGINFKPYQSLWVFITIIMLGVFYSFGLYRRKKSHSAVNVIDNTVKSVFLGTLLLFVAVYSVRQGLGKFPTSVLGISWIINTVLIGGWRLIAGLFGKTTPRRLLVVGKGTAKKNLLKNLMKNPGWGYRLVGVMDEEAGKIGIPGVLLLKSTKNIRNFILKEKIDEVIIALPDNMHNRISDIVSQCHGLNVRFSIIPNLYEIFLSRTDGEEIDGLPLVEVMVSPIGGMDEIIKRLLDIVVSVAGLLLVLPFLLILMMFHKIEDKGSVFFMQERVGKDGKVFNCYKLRTMREGAEDDTGPVLAKKDDRRVTKSGRVLRKMRIDEIPQLINVLKGDMSLVGPRPERPFFVEKFKKDINGYVERLQVKPGITGLAQVNSSYDISARDKLHFDLMYVRKQSVFVDLKIMLKTFWVMFSRKGAI